MDEKVKKMYLLMIMRAQKVPRLKCGIFEIGLPLYLEVSFLISSSFLVNFSEINEIFFIDRLFDMHTMLQRLL